jgi:hypothetical protein
MRRIHIVSVSPRAGTTLLAESMRVCFAIDAYHPHESKLRDCLWRKKIYLSKRPSDILEVGPRLFLDPRLTVICMMRDPRDVIVSRHNKAPDEYYTSLITWKDRVRYIRPLQHHPRFVFIRYEDLVADPDGCQKFIMQRIPELEEKALFSAFGQSVVVSDASIAALGSVREMKTDRIANWKNHKPRVVAQLQRFGPITDELIEFGYERDDRWLEELRSIDPDFSVDYSKLQRRRGYARRSIRAIKSRLHAIQACAAWALGLSWG